MSGLFVVFEGGEGAGKSTQVAALAEALRDAGREVVVTFEPGDSYAGASIRRLLLDPATGELSPRAEALLYAADKAQHVDEVIAPALARGATVICDRYVDSTLAYQGAGRALAVEDLERLSTWATRGLRPDLTVLLDADPARTLAGIASKDRIEGAGEPFHVRVRELFLALAARDPDRYLVLPARTGTPAEINERIVARLATMRVSSEP